MAIERKPPSRPGHKPTTKVVRPGAPRTDHIPAAAPRTDRIQAAAPQRGYAPPPAAKNNTPMIIGACVAGGALLLFLIVAMSSGSGDDRPTTTPRKTPSPSAAAPRKVDVSQLVRDGERSCEEGHRIIVGCEGAIAEYKRSGAGREELCAKLERGMALIKEGNALLGEANTKSNGEQGFSDNKYGSALKLAKMMVSELKQ